MYLFSCWVTPSNILSSFFIFTIFWKPNCSFDKKKKNNFELICYFQFLNTKLLQTDCFTDIHSLTIPNILWVYRLHFVRQKSWSSLRRPGIKVMILSTLSCNYYSFEIYAIIDFQDFWELLLEDTETGLLFRSFHKRSVERQKEVDDFIPMHILASRCDIHGKTPKLYLFKKRSPLWELDKCGVFQRWQIDERAVTEM